LINISALDGAAAGLSAIVPAAAGTAAVDFNIPAAWPLCGPAAFKTAAGWAARENPEAKKIIRAEVLNILIPMLA